MKHDFDKKIKNLLEDASLSDTGFELDKNAVWDSIQAKQKPKVIPFQKWISHAAAVIVGILLCLPFLLHKPDATEKMITITKTISTPAQIIRDTVFIQQPIINPAKANNTGNTTKEIHYANEKAADKALQPNILSPKNIENSITNSPQPVVTFTEPPVPKTKVMHLLDMDNENAIPRAKRIDDYKLFNKITIASNNNDRSETISMIIGSRLSNSKN